MRELIDRDDAIEAVNNRFTEAQLWDCRQIRNIVGDLLRSLPAAEKGEGRTFTGISAVMSNDPLTVEEAKAYQAAMDRPPSTYIGKLLPEVDHDTSGDAAQST